MLIFVKVEELKTALLKTRQEKKSVGFVPTMGALHEGHLSLIKKSLEDNDLTVCSVFVNPAQFNEKTDYMNYPRNLNKDFQSLEKTGCDVVFTPTEHEIYPEEDNRAFDFGYLGKIMEGKFRDGHFEGVAKVVTKLFDIVRPNKAYFGEKDYQQLLIIKKIVKDLNFPVQIVPCEIIREPDGLVMSSRNLRLSVEKRKIASFIYQILKQSVKLAGQMPVKELTEWVYNEFNKKKNFKIEYFFIVNNQTLEEIKNWDEKAGKIGCIAVWLEGIRLIDNIKYNL